MSLADIIQSIPSKHAGQELCQLGCIKLGGKSKQVRTGAGGTTWRAPEKYDAFQITTMNRDAQGDLIVDRPLMEQLIARHGDPDGKLRRIPIRALSDNLDDVLQSAFVWYGGKTCAARSDGRTVTWYFDPRSGKRLEHPREDEWAPEMLEMTNSKGQKLFKAFSTFNAVIAAEEARWGGVYRFRTTSVISLRQLHASLLHLLQLTGGVLMGMPLMLCVRPIQVAPEGRATTVHVVHVELRGGDLVQLQEKALEMARFRLAFADQIRTTTTQYRKLLAAPGTEPAEEIAEIVDEFVPEDAPDQSGSQEPAVTAMPEQTRYSLLDDDPPAPVPSTPSEPTREEPPPAERTPAEPTAVASVEPAPAVEAPKATLSPWEDFLANAREVGQSQAVSGTDVMASIGKWLVRLRLKGKENTVPAAKLAELLCAMNDGRWHWMSGTVLPASAASSPGSVQGR
jgi:hypothetical protein